jgi:hypothetical protein
MSSLVDGVSVRAYKAPRHQLAATALLSFLSVRSPAPLKQ